jgi:hypothetical protein
MGVHKTEVYPEIKALLGIPEDEPIFILRAKDNASVSTLSHYENTAAALGSSDEFCIDVSVCTDNFENWRDKNRGKTKVPD